jgi:hypothetical protein
MKGSGMESTRVESEHGRDFGEPTSGGPIAKLQNLHLQKNCRTAWAFIAGFLALSVAGSAAAIDPFIDGAVVVHPACVESLVMKPGETVSVVRSVNLSGCRGTTRTASKVEHREQVVLFEDEVLLGGGSFGYRHLSTLDNGLFILGIRRESPDGIQQVSLAAVGLYERPQLLQGQVVKRMILEMIGEVRIKDIRLASVSTIGNTVRFSAGIGASKVDRIVDLSKIGKAMK